MSHLCRYGDLPRLAAILIAVVLMSLPGRAAARDDDGGDRARFYGIVEVMPLDMYGVWTIGGRQVVATRQTEFDQFDGPLMTGACARVDIRNGRVHEIDSEPLEACRGPAQ